MGLVAGDWLKARREDGGRRNALGVVARRDFGRFRAVHAFALGERLAFQLDERGVASIGFGLLRRHGEVTVVAQGAALHGNAERDGQNSAK